MASDYKQYNYQGYTYSYGPFSQQACGPCSVADIVNMSPLTVAQWLTNNGYSTYQSGTEWEGIAPALSAFGAGGKTLFVGWDVSSAAIEEFKKSIQNGYEGVLCMGARAGTYWTTGGHYICVCGYKDGQYLVHDPASTARTGWHPWSDFEGNVKCAYTSTARWGGEPVNYKYSFTLKQIKVNDSGKQVRLLQRLLFSRGFYAYKSIDGSFGPKTEAAVKKYQQAVNKGGGKLTVDGVCGPSTWQSIFGIKGKVTNDKVKITVEQIESGAENIYVLLVQELLMAYKLYNSSLDMKYGPATVAAVRAFQAKKKIAVDGVCGPTTFKKLLNL